jgi:hypothetical protein
MFRRAKIAKTRLELRDMRLTDIPPMHNLLFLKVKQGRSFVRTRKFPIEKSRVNFEEPIIFDYALPCDSRAHHPKPLRLSFRQETSTKSGFTRFGNCEIDIMEMIVNGATEVSILLSECAYNTYFAAQLYLPGGSPFSPTRAVADDAVLNPVFATDESWSSNSSDRAQSHSQSSRSGSDPSVQLTHFLFESMPHKVTFERFRELEQQVDDLLAAIITERVT